MMMKVILSKESLRGQIDTLTESDKDQDQEVQIPIQVFVLRRLPEQTLYLIQCNHRQIQVLDLQWDRQ